MNQKRAEELRVAQEQAHTALSAATAEIATMPEGEERSRNLRALATLLVGASEEVRASAVRQCPDLEGVKPVPDTLLDSSEQEFVTRLTQCDLIAIDNALIENTATSWRKVVRVIGAAMVTLDGQFSGIPLGLYVQRVGELVQSGELLAQGDIQFIRLGEVRLPAPGESTAQCKL